MPPDPLEQWCQHIDLSLAIPERHYWVYENKTMFLRFYMCYYILDAIVLIST